MKLYLGDVIRTRKPHPCSGDTWEIERVGADIGIRCRTCGRYTLVSRPRLERRIVAFLKRGSDQPQTPAPLSVSHAAKTEPIPRRARKTAPPPEPGVGPRRRIIRKRESGNEPTPPS
ncbi:MAG: DUF951 domain-containing protein [Armatimonadetes bacterium]|nr:DUF951 domain-containing protein [Armatimonadota bacterium]